MKRIAALWMSVVVLVAACVGCAPEQKLTRIAIVSISKHPAFLALESAVTAQLSKLGYQNSQTARVECYSAENQPAKAGQIIKKLAAEQADLVIAVSSPVAMAALKYVNDVRLMFAAVTDPLSAGLCTNTQRPDKNFTGTSDYVPVERILDLILHMLPESRRLGLLYNPTERGSAVNMADTRAYCRTHDLEFEEAAVSNPGEAEEAAGTLLDCDAIFIPADSTVAAAMPAVARLCVKAKLPCFVGTAPFVTEGALAGISVDFNELARETAVIADKLLRGAPAASIPVMQLNNYQTYVNMDTARALGIVFSDAFLKEATTVTTKGGALL
ncbi:MAG: ABC transporter substrate-binding protein [Oscillospiraceae bacterium]|jgi:putative ABC transport system substrate-binding protein|nr:ABC transporter substrate-binding protein [Oscillospiraceae bacterium]